MDNSLTFCEIWESFEQTCDSENLHQLQSFLLSEENKKIIMNSIIKVISSIPENYISQSDYEQIYRRVFS